ncbi:methionine ABC transporter ATP-binding protein, partial [Bacillus sp. LL01]
PVLDVFRKPKEEMTKEFVKQITEPEETTDAIKQMLADHPEGHIVQLTFVGEEAESPLITQLIRTFDVEVNIVQGKITKIHEGSYGTLFVALNGQKEEVERAIAFIQSKKVEVEVITYA